MVKYDVILPVLSQALQQVIERACMYTYTCIYFFFLYRLPRDGKYSTASTRTAFVKPSCSTETDTRWTRGQTVSVGAALTNGTSMIASPSPGTITKEVSIRQYKAYLL